MQAADVLATKILVRALLEERGAYRDPIDVLIHDDDAPVLWEYPESKTEPFIPGHMHPKQIEAHEAVARHKWLFWGNQVGKTTWGAQQCVLWALGRHPQQHWEPPLTIWASALTWELWEQIVLPELLTWLPPECVIDAPLPHARSTKRTILVRADNGTTTRIIGKAAKQGPGLYQSARIHVFWMDEEQPQAIWNEVQPRLVRHGGVTIATITPLLGLTWLYHHVYDPWKRGLEPAHWCSHAGLADNPAIGEAEIEALKSSLAGDPVQLGARLYGHFGRPSGIALKFDPKRHLEHTRLDDLKKLAKTQEWTHFGGVDFGSWRFSFLHLVADRANRGRVVGEVFSQREDLEVQAGRIDDELRSWDVEPSNMRIWGDDAVPVERRELNKALRRVAARKNLKPYYVTPVAAENKLRIASVTRINNLLHRDALLVRAGMNDFDEWRLHLSAASDGTPMLGSRLLWEMNQWRYPTSREPAEEAQKQDPKDDTADGADCIAALRYAVMSHWSGAKVEQPEPKRNPNIDLGLERLAARIKRELREQRRAS